MKIHLTLDLTRFVFLNMHFSVTVSTENYEEVYYYHRRLVYNYI
jgi:hypothetical protein